MTFNSLLPSALLAVWLITAPIRAADPSLSPLAHERAVDYLRDIKPVLKERCYACHGALKQESTLRLDTAASILRGGESGPAIVQRASAKSRLIEAVTWSIGT